MTERSTQALQTKLTLKDRLSRLSYAQVRRLLGPYADRLMRAGGG